MKLILSSNGVSSFSEEAVEELDRLVGVKKRVVSIENAKDYISPADRQAHTLENKAHFERLGYEWTELDLRDYFGYQEQLAIELQPVNFVWLSGGNTFILRRAMAYSGLDNILTERAADGSIVYGGSSAGAIVVTSTLRGCESADDPTVTPKGYKEKIIWDGLGLIDRQIVPHYQAEYDAGESEAMTEYFETSGLKYETLRDGEALFIDCSKIEKVSPIGASDG